MGYLTPLAEVGFAAPTHQNRRVCICFFMKNWLRGIVMVITATLISPLTGQR
jgi:hypothetical protein